MKKLFSFLLSFIVILSIIPFNIFTAFADIDSYFTYTLIDGEAKIINVDDSISGEITVPYTLGGYIVTGIGYEAFENCDNITSIIIQDNIKYIESNAFSWLDNLENIILPDTDIEISNSAFYGCAIWDNDDNWENDVLYIGKHCISAKDTLSGDYSIKSGTITIAQNAFDDCSELKSVTIPDSVIKICGYAFDDCTSLTKFTIPDSVMYIGERILYNCSSIEKIIIPFIGENINNAQSLSYIFGWSKEDIPQLLKEIVITNATNIAADTFVGCENLCEISIPDTIDEIGSYAFYGSGFYNDENNWNDGALYCGNHLISVMPNTFGKFEIKKGTICIANDAFEDCTDITSVSIPEGISKIPSYCFSYCSGLSKIDLPESISTIGHSAFYYCINLKSINIPKNLKTVYNNAFYNCYNLQDVYISDLESWCNIDFKEEESYDFDYSSPLSIADKLYLNNRLVTDIVLPNTIQKIPSFAFSCDSLKSITIPDTVNEISEYAFYGCHGLEKVTIPNSVTKINSCTFSGCDNLKEVDMPSSVTEIGNKAFEDCDSFTSFKIPDTVKTLGSSAFYSCSNLQKVIIGNGINIIDEYLFQDCPKLKAVYIPKSVKLIRNNVFTSYYDDWYDDWYGLESIYYEGTKDEWEEITILSNEQVLEKSKILYNSKVSQVEAICADHIYSNDCDSSCNNCGYNRYVSGHRYSYECDCTCDICGYKRNAYPHYYRNDCDIDCNYCGYIRVVGEHIFSSESDTSCNECGAVRKIQTKKVGTIKLNKTKFTYNGKTQKPSVVAKDSSGKTISSKYYTVSGTKSAKNIGKYKINVTFKGIYTGSKTLSYEIVKPSVNKASLSKLSAAKKSLKVSIKKASSVSGYEIEYSTSKSFKSSKKKATTKTSYTIKSLKSKKNYYVRVRSYKTIGGKKFYSSWSKAFKKKTK